VVGIEVALDGERRPRRLLRYHRPAHLAEPAMPKTLQWTDVQDIAILLAEKHPTVEPLSVRFTDLHAMVLALPGFAGDPKKSGEKILEAIQMAWVDEVED